MKRALLIIVGLAVSVAVWFSGQERAEKLAREKAHRAAAQREMNQTFEAVNQEVINELETGEASSATDRHERMANALAAAGQASGGAEGKAMTVLGALIKEMGEKGTALEKASENVEELFDFASMMDLVTLTARRKIADKLIEENTAFIKDLEGLEDRLRTLLDDEKVERRVAHLTVADFKAGIDPIRPHRLTICRTEIAMLKDLLEKYDLLEKESGRWSVSEDNEIHFESDAAAEAFNKLSASAAAVGAEQDVAREAAVEALKKQGNLLRRAAQ